MTKTHDPLAIVREVGAINFEGNITPHSWYKHLRHEGGKPNLVAITLLGELVYWYRPVVERDEASGRVTSIRKKFTGDKYRTSYAQMGERFGFTRRQTQDAIGFLADQGIITKEIRDRVQTGEEMHGNVLFLEICPDRLRQISEVDVDDYVPSYDPPYEGHTVERTTLIPQNVQASYTPAYDISENPTETSSEKGGGVNAHVREAEPVPPPPSHAAADGQERRETIIKLKAMGAYNKQITAILKACPDLTVEALDAWKEHITRRGAHERVMWAALANGQTWPPVDKPAPPPDPKKEREQWRADYLKNRPLVGYQELPPGFFH